MAFRGTFSPSFNCYVRAGSQGIAIGNNTLAAWVRFDNLSAAYEVIEINDSGGGVFASAIILNGNQVQYCQRNNAGTGNADFLGSVLSANTWYHVALTYDGTTLRGYLNGVPDGTHAGVTGTRNNWSDLQVGPTLGEIQDAMFFTRALTADEIAALARARVPKNPQNLRHWLPFFPGSNRNVDYSGNALNFTASGSPVDGTADPPPVGWGAGDTRILYSNASNVSITGSGTTNTTGTAAVSSAAGLAPTGTTQTTGAAALTASAPLAETGLTRTTGAATVTAAAPLAASGVTQTTGAATTSAAFSQTASGLTRTQGAAALTAAAALAATGSTQVSGTATVTASASLAASGVTNTTGAAALNSGSSFTIAAAGVTNTSGTASATAAAPITASGLTTTTGATGFVGQLSATGSTAVTGSVTMTASASITAAGLVSTSGLAVFQGTGGGGSIILPAGGDRRGGLAFGTRRRIR